MRAEYYETIEELPLHIYIDISTGGSRNLLLKKRGFFGKKDVDRIWSMLSEQCSMITNEKDLIALMDLTKQEFKTSSSIFVIESIISISGLIMSNDARALLKESGVVLPPVPDLKSDVRKAKARVKFLKMQASRIAAELAPFAADRAGKITKKDFLESLSILSKFQGYRIDPETTTVAEYLSITNNYKNQWQTQKK